jgi:hypothetical protein
LGVQSVRHVLFGYIRTVWSQLQLIVEGYTFHTKDGRQSLRRGDHLCRGEE